MSEHDESDPDREAIMARRRRFIALALGGLTTGCAPGKPGPSPTSTSTSSTTSTSGSSTSDTGESGSNSDKYDLPPESESESDSGTETETGGTTGPRPCLVPPGTRP